MINLPKYPTYKHSGEAWLGEIPEHWMAVSLVSLMELKSDKNHPDFEVLSVYREYGVIQKDSRDDNHNATSLDKTNYKAVAPGDLVVNKMKAWQGSMGVSSFKGIVSPAYITCKITSKNIYSEYLHRLLRCNSYIGEYNRISYGVRVGQWDMHYEDFKRVTVLVPPLPEQTAIATFLDRKTALIDQAIGIKDKQIDLLKERRQILIHKAVTRGLNPDVKLKDSGVEWIGEIPEGWEVKKIKQLGKIINGYAFNSNEFKDEGVRVMKIANIQTMKTDWSDESFIDEKYYYQLPQFRVNKNDLVFALTRPIISTGIKATIIEDDFKILLNQRNAVLKPLENLNKKWIYFIILDSLFVQSFEREIDITGQQPNISTNSIGNIKIPFPAIKEQNIISEFIETITSKIATAISLKEQEIEKLKEYKASLINSAVTGKIKVN
ncbi:MAG: restriction endonuclease subunit S [Mariniphaga sp.]|nr:restriction endonuclease subunit S [Mariniphaga sp.]